MATKKQLITERNKRIKSLKEREDALRDSMVAFELQDPKRLAREQAILEAGKVRRRLEREKADERKT